MTRTHTHQPRSPRILVAVAVIACGMLVSAQDTPTSIRAGLLIDGRGDTQEEVRIIIKDGTISRIDRLRGAVTHDLSEFVLMPGLIDTHVHLTSHFNLNGTIHVDEPGDDGHTLLYALENAYATLMSGFTTVQSVGNYRDVELRAFLSRGMVPGPRVLTSLQPVTAQTGNPAFIRVFVQRLASIGADVVKVMASDSIFDGGKRAMSDEQIEAACSEATAQGLRTLVHAYGSEVISAAIRAGCTSIEHGVRYDDGVVALLAQKGTYLDPQIGLLYQNYTDHRDRFVGFGSYTSMGYARMEEARVEGLDTFRRTVENRDVKMVFGSDAVAGAHGRNAEELIARVRFGHQSPMAALMSATSVAASALGLGDEIGTVAPGFKADIIAVERNPLNEIQAVRNVKFVMRNGRVYRNEVRPVAPQRPSRQRRR